MPPNIGAWPSGEGACFEVRDRYSENLKYINAAHFYCSFFKKWTIEDFLLDKVQVDD